MLKRHIKIGRWDIMIWYRELCSREEITVPYKDAKLLPCPFCGKEAKYNVNQIPEHWIRCRGGIFEECSFMVRMGCERCTIYECPIDKRTELCEYIIYNWNRRPVDEEFND